MRTLLVTFDSLNRHFLPPFGCDWVHAPNFRRLAEKTVTFENCYVGSMPCMPARREMHTGRYDFMHRGWGPLEPFDDSMPEILKTRGIHSHLTSDHYHYWEDGGANYHNRYTTWEFFRGQEGDSWKGDIEIEIPETVAPREGRWWEQEWVNRKHTPTEKEHCQNRTFDAGLEFMRTNRNSDSWFLHIETFDPHEPYFTHQKFKDLYPHNYNGPQFDWPPYGRLTETPEQVEHIRYEYAALLSMCDENLGRVLDLMDERNLWEDTLLIVNTDHGFLLGEKGQWAKCIQPFYNEIARIPLFIWDPRVKRAGERRKALVQTIDLAPTILDYFGIPPTPHMQGAPLLETLESDSTVRDYALYGMHGAQVNITDGRTVYMRAPVEPDSADLYHYTLMPGNMNDRERIEVLQKTEFVEPFSFSKGCPLIRYPRKPRWDCYEYGNLLFDLESDPHQEKPLSDPELEAKMVEALRVKMRECEAPEEQYKRLGL
jgi:arylsulfatase A-like enzyme